MKYYRYMSFNEFHDMGLGLTIMGKSFPNNRTSSSGVCFLGENTLVEASTVEANASAVFSAPECYSFLSGIVSSDVLVEFEVEDGIMTESYGVYADPFYLDWDSTVVITEYCIPCYNRDIAVPVRYCVDFGCGGVNPVWYDYH